MQEMNAFKLQLQMHNILIYIYKRLNTDILNDLKNEKII